jgi:hypothetical protein
MGISRKQTIDKVIHIGHRAFLPETHIMRYCGMSKRCCPRGYYEGTQDTVDAVNVLFNNFKTADVLLDEDNATPKITARWTIGDNKKDKTFTSKPLACDGNCSEAEPDSVLFNTGYNWDHFKDFVFFAHCNFCEVRKYSRHPDTYYETHGRDYEKKFSSYTRKFRSEINGPLTALIKLKIADKIKKLLKDKAVKGLSPYYALIYRKNRAGFRDSVCFEPFHCIMNVAEKVIVMMKGEKFKVDKHLVLALCEQRFPFMVASTSKGKTTQGIESTAETTNAATSSSCKRTLKKRKVSAKKTKRNQYTDIPNNSMIPFTLVKRQQELVDWRMNCVVLPMGNKTSNKVRFIFRQTGYLKGNDKIKWLTTYLKFSLIFSDLIDPYKNFLSLLSDLVSEILSPVVTDDFIADLFMKTVEALCFWESMFIDSEQYFSVHELLDIVDALGNFGPARGWWALAGERFMAKVKNFCPKGGSNCLLTLYNRFVAYENNCKFNYTVDTDFLDNLGRYSDNMIKLSGDHTVLSTFYWNDWVKNRFYMYLFQYIHTLEQDKIYLSSPFIRLFETYTQLKDLKQFTAGKTPVNFLEWIKMMVLFDFSDDCVNIEWEDALTSDMIANCILNGVVLSRDIDTIVALVEFYPLSYQNATIKGVHMRGRGVKYSELRPAQKVRKYGGATDLILPSNPKNDLLELWEQPEQYSSFIKFNNWRINNSTKRNTSSVQYGQSNYFFRMILPTDPYIHNVAFANYTGRINQTHTVSACSVPYIKVKITTIAEIPPPPLPIFTPVQSSEIDANFIIPGERRTRQNTDAKSTQAEIVPVKPPFVIINNFKFDGQFVGVNFIVSTSVAVCGMTADNTPIFLPDNVKGFSPEELLDAEKFCCKDPREIVDLYLIDMDPSRRLVETNKHDSTLTENMLNL